MDGRRPQSLSRLRRCDHARAAATPSRRFGDGLDGAGGQEFQRGHRADYRGLGERAGGKREHVPLASSRARCGESRNGFSASVTARFALGEPGCGDRIGRVIPRSSRFNQHCTRDDRGAARGAEGEQRLAVA